MPSTHARPRLVIALPALPTPSETWIFHHLAMVRHCGFTPLLLIDSDACEIPAALRNYAESIVFVPGCPRGLFARIRFVLREFFASGEMLRLLATLNPCRFGRRVATLAFFRWARALRQLRPFVLVHCHYLFTAEIAGALRRCKYLEVPVIGSAHGFDLIVWPQLQPPSVFPGFLSSVDLLTFGSQFMLDRFVSRGIPGPALRLIPLGVDPDRFADRRPAKPAGVPLIVLSVGRLTPFKGHEVGLRAFALLVAKFPQARYWLAGAGPERGKLEALAVELGIERQVRFLGLQNESQLTELYTQADIFLFPSLTAPDRSQEGQGLSLLEAQAALLPVVASDSGGIPENLVPNKSGFLVPERAVEVLAERLGALASDPDRRAEFGRAGRDFVLQKRSLASTQSQFAGLYRDAIG